MQEYNDHNNKRYMAMKNDYRDLEHKYQEMKRMNLQEENPFIKKAPDFYGGFNKVRPDSRKDEEEAWMLLDSFNNKCDV